MVRVPYYRRTLKERTTHIEEPTNNAEPSFSGTSSVDRAINLAMKPQTLPYRPIFLRIYIAYIYIYIYRIIIYINK